MIRLMPLLIMIAALVNLFRGAVNVGDFIIIWSIASLAMILLDNKKEEKKDD